MQRSIEKLGDRTVNDKYPQEIMNNLSIISQALKAAQYALISSHNLTATDKSELPRDKWPVFNINNESEIALIEKALAYLDNINPITTYDFGYALTALREGKKVRQKFWHDYSHFYMSETGQKFWRDSSYLYMSETGQINIKFHTGDCKLWEPSQLAVLAEDWEIAL
jgi:hypothetical protein